MKNHALIQTEKARRESRLLLAQGVHFDKAKEIARKRNMVVTWHWSTGNVWGPIGSAREKRNATA